MIALLVGCASLSMVAAWSVLRPWMRASADQVAGGAVEGLVRGERTPGARRPSRAVFAAAVVTLAVVAAPFVMGVLRSPGAAAPQAGTLDALLWRVQDAPEDVSARLDLAAAYLASGDPASAAGQYEDVLRLDPANPEAHAQLAWVLLGAARPRAALAETERALGARPDYPEALFVRGMALRRLHRGAAAARAFRAYLNASPFGAYRSTARRFVRAAGSEVPSHA